MLMTNGKDNKNVFTDVADEYVREAERIKKAWFDHVLSSMEKLNANVNKLSADVYNVKETLFKDIILTKDALRKDISANKAELGSSVDKLEKRIEKSMDKITKSVDDLAVAALKDELKKDLDNLKEKHDKDLKEVQGTVTTLKVKVGVIAFISGIIGAALLTGIIDFVVHILKNVPKF
jgi:DNA anti-recombination protein RmuC